MCGKAGIAPGSVVFKSLCETAAGLGIAPQDLPAALLGEDGAGALQARCARAAGGGADNVDLHAIPAGGFQRSVDGVVVAGEEHGSIVAEERLDKLGVVGVAELMGVAAGFAGSGDIRRVSVGKPAGTCKAREDVAPVSALDLHVLDALVHLREVAEAVDPRGGRIGRHARTP